MSQKRGYTNEQVAECYQRHGTVRGAARELGICPKSIREHIARWESRQTLSVINEIPPDVPTVDTIERRIKDYNAKAAIIQAQSFRRIAVNIDGPIGILHMGDPHVDDDGTDIGQLFHHCKLTRDIEGLYAANIGDVTNNWVGRLARLYGEQSTSAKQGREIAEHFLSAADWLYIVGGNHDCHDVETEALTRRGWKSYEKIYPDDEVLSLDTKTGKSRWTPITHIKVFPYSGEMVNIDVKKASAFITPNHRVLCKQSRKGGEWLYQQAGDLRGRIHLPVSSQSGNPEYAELTDDQISLAGWILTDGGVSRSKNTCRVSIYQSKGGEEIQGLLDRLGLAYNHSERRRNITHVCGRALVKEPLPQHEWRLSAESSRAVLGWFPEKGRMPYWADWLSDRQFDVLLGAIVDGDGCWDGKNPGAKNCALIHGTKQFLESLQAQCVRHGWSAKLSIARGKDYRLSVYKRRAVCFDTTASKKLAYYNGIVWCLTVPMGNFLVRRNGACHFSGNSWTQGTGVLDWFSKQYGYMASGQFQYHAVRLGLEFPNGFQCRINARHDFRGSSEHHPTHGPAKASRFGFYDHILICGHRHISGYEIAVNPDPITGDGEVGLVSHCIRVGTYKKVDSFAREKGLPYQNCSPGVVTIIDPQAVRETQKVLVFLDADAGADYLKYLRKKK